METLMNRVDVFVDLQALLAEYWASVDRVADVQKSSASFYVETGEMILGSLHVKGRDNIAAFFASRNEKEIANRRSTRHFTANLRLGDLRDERATVHALVVAYAGCGDWPLPSQPPSAVGDFSFSCVHDQAYGWRFEKVAATTVFVSPAAATFAKGSRPDS
jgi:hypothetical protein